MSGNHDHVGSDVRFERPLWWALALTTTFLVAEVIGGLMTNSLALLSDAAHMLTDAIALGVSLIAVRISKRPADARRSYGYGRMESLGALVNGSLLFVVAGYILWEAIGRFTQPPEVASTGMLIVAVVGLVVNVIAMRLLKAGSGDSLNLKGAYLEVWSDMLGSVGVIVGAVVIKWTGWTVLDSIVAVLIGLWVLPRTWVLLRSALHVLMQGVPQNLDMGVLKRTMLEHPQVMDVHDLHAWSLASRQAIVTAHLLVAPNTVDLDQVRREVASAVYAKADVHELTLQAERVPCSEEDQGHGPVH
ncbi:cation diffusion facilitator family transporter [Xanthomonas phaseoli pv. syngonii LMG 9055]|uniref:Cation diffusion facilitator family transporter n=1 Tax=Xanthomonas phaseoli pv. syngonii LMG 9055 TaxID=1437878 RepID=A0A1V9GKP7_9XANT|nr:cation diffusion facilitator family transporter [Xanthomonas phaseoli pv. syngonii LMG 9055]